MPNIPTNSSDGHLAAFTDSLEGYAAAAVERALGARVEARDVLGAPQRTVDAEIIYADGSTAALEVTSAETRDIWHLRKLVEGKGSTSAPGRLSWFIRPQTVDELHQLVRIHERVIELCEAHGVDWPLNLPGEVVMGDADLEWIAWSAQLRMSAHPPGERGPRIYWEQRMESAVYSSEAEVIAEGVAAALNDELIVRHLDKLLNDPHDERHLFLVIGSTGLSNAAAFSLIEPAEL
ncbi:MAG: hypothetical protein M3N46_09905, partial [Actinomycetota bacterium]|nr:hypothetical protein [Actinomycetota bacterium]